MVRHGDDFDEVGALKIDDAERKPVQEKPPKAPMYPRPAPRSFRNVQYRRVQFNPKSISNRPIAREVPSDCGFRLIRSERM